MILTHATARRRTTDLVGEERERLARDELAVEELEELDWTLQFTWHYVALRYCT